MENSPGFYGKFPELGDFVNRRLPKQFIDPWDEWLQGAVASSRQQLGDSWLNTYLTSPIWRFAITKGLCGEFAWCGLMMPSVDKVGRYFPLILACRLPIDVNLVQLSIQGSGWFEMAEKIILSVLDDNSFSMEGFDARVTALGGLDELADISGSQVNLGFGTAWQVPMGPQGIIDAMPQLTHQLLLQRLGNYSFWWGGGSQSVTPSMLVCAGMPLIGDFSAMLTGNWQAGSWEQWPNYQIQANINDANQ